MVIMFFGWMKFALVIFNICYLIVMNDVIVFFFNSNHYHLYKELKSLQMIPYSHFILGLLQLFFSF